MLCIMKRNEILATDRSVRSKDADGHLRVSTANISKANVCPYYGREIPGWRDLGLDPNRVYMLYRAPDELARGAASMAGKPLLYIHKAMDAEDHDREVVVGCVGTDVTFEDPYLRASLMIWDGEGVELVDSGKQKELSPGYRYDPDMTPGEVTAPGVSFGLKYDGVMRNIAFNHLALVEEGRTGPDVVIGDHQLETDDMFKLKPRKSARAKALIAAMDGKLTSQAQVDALDAELEKMDEEEEKRAQDEGDDPVAGKTAADEDEEDDDKAMDAKIAAAVTSAVAEQSKKTEDRIKAAVDQALTANDAKHADMDEARRIVRPIVGDLTQAVDSAADIYRFALDQKGIDHKDVKDVAALKVLVQHLGKPAEKPTQAADAAAAKNFYDRFPDAKRVRA